MTIYNRKTPTLSWVTSTDHRLYICWFYASDRCNPLKKALDTWKDVKFNFAATDVPDLKVQNTKEVLKIILTTKPTTNPTFY